MADPLPAGMDRETVAAHAASMQIVAETINLTASYMRAEPGTVEEGAAEDTLNDALSMVASLSLDEVANIVLGFASLLIEVAEPEAVQEWFNNQHEKIVGALALFGAESDGA